MLAAQVPHVKENKILQEYFRANGSHLKPQTQKSLKRVVKIFRESGLRRQLTHLLTVVPLQVKANNLVETLSSVQKVSSTQLKTLQTFHLVVVEKVRPTTCQDS